MSNNGAVYQPTTVTYDADSRFPDGGGTDGYQRRWSGQARPVSYMARAVLHRRPRTCCSYPSRRTLATLYCSSSAASAAIGITLIVHGTFGCCDTTDRDSVYVTVITIGAVTVLLSVALLLLYLRHTRRCCFRMRRSGCKDPHLGVPCTLQPGAIVQVNNPSTDQLLVTAQPTAQTPEHAHLMPNGAPPLDDDPRILLRPLDAALDLDDTVT